MKKGQKLTPMAFNEEQTDGDIKAASTVGDVVAEKLHPTQSQRARYAAVIEVTIRQLRTNGYDQFKIQEVSQETGIALATIYRYFKSRERLIYVATQGWIEQVTGQSLKRGKERRIEERLVRLIRESAQKLVQEPELLKAWARVNLSTEPNVSEIIRNRHPLHSQLIELVGLSNTAAADELSVMIGHVWFSGVTRWSMGQKEYRDVHGDVERVALLVLRAHQEAES